MLITGTFLDEISHDIPHQNWGPQEWDQDFQYMKAAGIDTVILIRCGYRKQLTFPCRYLMQQHGCFPPSLDLVDLFLCLSEKYDMNFFFGLYDSGAWWDSGNASEDLSANKFVCEEAWQRYGHYPAFKGWYLSMEISRRTREATDAIAEMGNHCKQLSNNLPTFISPWIDGKKALSMQDGIIKKHESISLKQHEEEWNEIFDGIKNAVDIVAFQDGHVEYHELYDYLTVNKQLADKYGLRSWTNCESFDRDMPIKFLPIKFDLMKLKLEAAEKAGCEKAITFEFSHFMSPQSMYGSARHLYNRYLEYKKQKTESVLKT
ncbi:MAG: DUF4434 domain-containing protein [Chitinophagaceae bacterium]|nr:DUF4434 domain-containing protein [Chitinophagaceae bacterium]